MTRSSIFTAFVAMQIAVSQASPNQCGSLGGLQQVGPLEFAETRGAPSYLDLVDESQAKESLVINWVNNGLEFVAAEYEIVASVDGGHTHENVLAVVDPSTETVSLTATAADLCPLVPPPRICCRAYNAACMSCAAGMSEEAYCKSLEERGETIAGCPNSEVEAGLGLRFCCQAVTSSCKSCSQGVTELEYCTKNAETPGCAEVLAKEQEQIVTSPSVCCQASTASCMACNAGVSVRQYCQENPDTVGCGFFYETNIIIRSNPILGCSRTALSSPITVHCPILSESEIAAARNNKDGVLANPGAIGVGASLGVVASLSVFAAVFMVKRNQATPTVPEDSMVDPNPVFEHARQEALKLEQQTGEVNAARLDEEL